MLVMIWGSYAVIGSVLNYIDKGFKAFIVTLNGLSSSLVVLDVTILCDIVIVQIFSSVFILFGSAYLVVTGFRDLSKALKSARGMETT